MLNLLKENSVVEATKAKEILCFGSETRLETGMRYDVKEVTPEGADIWVTRTSYVWFGKDELTDFFKVVNTCDPVAFECLYDDLVPVTYKEQMLVAAVLATIRGTALEKRVKGEFIPVGRGTTVNTESVYRRVYREVDVPWGFIADWVVNITIDDIQDIYGVSADGEKYALPIKLDLSNVVLPAVIARPEE